MSALVVRPAAGAGFVPSRTDADPASKPAPTANRAVCRARAASTRARIAAGGSPRRSSVSHFDFDGPAHLGL